MIVLNPFATSKSQGAECLSYLTGDACNNILTRSGWTIIGVSHSIREGSYITTLKLRLYLPEADFADAAKGDGL